MRTPAHISASSSSIEVCAERSSVKFGPSQDRRPEPSGSFVLPPGAELIRYARHPSWVRGFLLNTNPYGAEVGRIGRPPTGQDPSIGFRIPVPLRDQLDAIAAREGMTRSALLVRIVRRYVDTYPLDEVD